MRALLLSRSLRKPLGSSITPPLLCPMKAIRAMRWKRRLTPLTPLAPGVKLLPMLAAWTRQMRKEALLVYRVRPLRFPLDPTRLKRPLYL
jgi:hypothetical protein